MIPPEYWDEIDWSQPPDPFDFLVIISSIVVIIACAYFLGE